VDPLRNQCTDARLDKIRKAFDLLRLMNREIPGQLVSCFLYIASHDGCHKQAMEEALNLTTASASRNTDWLASGRWGVESKGLGLITKEKIKGDRRIALRLTSEGRDQARTMKSIIYD
jgi:DNA-binding MarR family transcriptional regulator